MIRQSFVTSISNVLPYAGRHAAQLLALAVLSLAPLAPVLADIAAPQERPKSKLGPDVVESSGAYTKSIAIDVPMFHGIEPKIALGYNSSADNGFLGVGWTLGGLSFVERVSPGGGAPRYDASDVYFLDGEELTTCATFIYCRTHQTYQRIEYIAGTNQWTVTDTDGTKSTYNPLYSNTSGTFRWVLATEADTHNNTVTYNYWCDNATSGGNCYIDTITYNGATVTFHRGDRLSSDRPSFANGSNLGHTSYLLRAISVKVGTNVARAYGLGYYQSGTTKRYLLQSVQTFGTDAVVSASGDVTGTSLPATTFTYTGSAATRKAALGATPYGTNGGITSLNKRCISGDYNQDGNSSDLACYIWDDKWYIWLSTPNNNWVWGGERVLTTTGVTGTDGVIDITRRCIGGDFDRNGMSDVACYAEGSTGTWRVALSNGFPLAIGAGWTAALWSGGPAVNDVWVENCVSTQDGGQDCTWVVVPQFVRDRCFAGDLSGDGRTDLACHTDGSWSVARSTGSGWNNNVWNGPSVSATYIAITNRCLTGDYNGDGKTDISCQTGTQTGQWSTYLVNATGTNFTNAGNWSAGAVPLPVGDWCVTGDYNGDGKSDQGCYTGANGQWYIALSTGRSYVGSYWSGGVAPASGMVDTRCVAADINGDGRSDLTCVLNTSGSWSSSRSVGNGWHPVMNWTGSSIPTSVFRDRCVTGDHNGDGLADFTCNTSFTNNTWEASYPLGELGHPDLISTVNNSMGGKQTVTYAPSSRWADFNHTTAWANLNDMPVGRVLPTVKDIKAENGASVVETTKHSYQYAKWSHGLNRFVGFKRADVHPAGTVCIVSRFKQTDASPGALEEYAVYATKDDAADKPVSKTKRTYTESASAPYTSSVYEEEEHEQEGSSTSYRIGRKRYFYDTYGNVEKIYDYGDTTDANDDKTVYSVHNANTGNHVVNKPAFLKVYAGIGISGTLLAQTLNYYDNSASNSAAPIKGDLTKVSMWDDQRGGADLAAAHNDTAYVYDGYGNITRTTDPEGRVTNVTFHDSINTTYNNVYAIKTCQVIPGAADQCLETKWDKTRGLPLEAKDPNNSVSKTDYDKVGRKISETDSANNVTTWSYFGWGNPANQGVQELRPDGSPTDIYNITGHHWTNTYMDGFGRTWLVYKEGPSGTYWDVNLQEEVPYTTVFAKHTLYLDASQRIWKESNWYYDGETPVYTIYDYDVLGRVSQITLPDGVSKVKNTYHNELSKPYVKTVSEMGQETRTWRDMEDRIVKIEEKDGTNAHITTFEYNLLGNKVKTIDAQNHQTSATYDSLGRMLTQTRAGGAVWTFTYYKDGQIKTEKDNKNQTTTLTYDGLGRIKTKVSGGQTTTWYYDEAGYGSSIGHLTRVTYPGGSKSMSYDIRGKTTADTHCIDTVCRTLNSTYDSLGRQQTLTYPNGEVVTYAYDGGGRLYSVSGYVTAMGWSPAGQLVYMYYNNGTYNYYTYDSKREWLKTAAARVTNTQATLYTASYDYDASGRVKSMSHGTPTAVTRKYEYDSLNRLTKIRDANDVLIQSYTYNAIGNITNNSQVGNYTYGDANHKHAVTAAGTNNYTYDANGSMRTAPNMTLFWDADNRLSSLTKNGVTTTMVYDEIEQRTKKTTGASVSRYFNPFLEQISGTDVQYYYAGPILVSKKEAGAVAYYHADRLGSIRLITNASGGEANDYDYKAFGAYESANGNARNERRYTGHITDDESGLIYMGGRYYAATLGRFISADDLIANGYNPQALNRYSYVYNNPINANDPTGHITWLFSGVGGALIFGVSAILDGKKWWEVVAEAGVGFAAGAGAAKVLAKWVRPWAEDLKHVKKIKDVDARDAYVDKWATGLFGLSYGTGSAGLSAIRGEDWVRAFFTGFLAGNISAAARGFGLKYTPGKHRGKFSTYGSRYRRAGEGWNGTKAVAPGLMASFIAGVTAHEFLKKSNKGASFLSPSIIRSSMAQADFMMQQWSDRGYAHAQIRHLTDEIKVEERRAARNHGTDHEDSLDLIRAYKRERAIWRYTLTY